MSTPSSSPAQEDEPFRLELAVAAPPDAVWHALRDREVLRSWHGWQFDGLDAEIEEIFFTGVEEAAAERRLALDGGDTFEVEERDGGGALVRLTRGARDPDNEWDAYHADINEGWTTFLHQLRFALERHPGADRQTLHFSGSAVAGSPTATLGLDTLGERPVGGRYELSLAGEDVRGEVWFRTDNQVGLTVDSWGDGLVVVGLLPPSPSNEHGGAQAVLTTYGLDEVVLRDLERRWSSWWDRHVVPADVVADGSDPGTDDDPDDDTADAQAG